MKNFLCVDCPFCEEKMKLQWDGSLECVECRIHHLPIFTAGIFIETEERWLDKTERKLKWITKEELLRRKNLEMFK